MINVFFSEAAKYSMKSGTTEDVLFIGSHLDIGDISTSVHESRRCEFLSQIFHNKEFSTNEIEKLVEAAEEGKSIRIWKSNAPFSACGFAFVCKQLENIQCDLRVVTLENPQVGRKDTLISHNHWGEVDAVHYDSFLKDEVKLSEAEKKSQAALWRKLKEENSLLRAVVNGHLISVPENFYDYLLIKELSDNEFIVGELIGAVLGQYPLGVSDSWYLYRINQLIEENVLKITSPKSIVNPYQKTVKVNR